MLKDHGKLAQALPLYQEGLAARRDSLGESHVDTLTSQHNLANCYLAAGQLEPAEPLFRAALAARTETLGPRHPDTLARAQPRHLARRRATPRQGTSGARLHQSQPTIALPVRLCSRSCIWKGV